MTEYGKPEIMKFSENLKTPMELSSMESWSKDKCKFLENGKVLTKISRKTNCFQIHRTTGWHLCYIIRTNDDALIIFTAPEKGFVLNLSSAIYLKIVRNQTSSDRKMCKVKLKWKFGKVKLKFVENQLFIWRQRFLSTFGHVGDMNKSDTAIIRKRQNDKSNSKETEQEEDWDTTESMMSLVSNQFLRSFSSKSSENLKHLKNQIESIPPFRDTEKTDFILLSVILNSTQPTSTDSRRKISYQLLQCNNAKKTTTLMKSTIYRTVIITSHCQKKTSRRNA
ncbi:hypothetical protein X798_03977 [Onchocerca flexuosa]|uniref:DUF7778 domain-containing protein n=1 Tax=Onchocerca flexuosa TaxID=387005 RepID=A0A238BVV8_9BILA|nr:hypothetical protein X798_03977 [Onchocerca flexuosa]